FKGEPKEFAIVIPVPTVLEKSQIHIAPPGLIEHLDAFSAPRLVEYWDPDPCPVAENKSTWGAVRMSAELQVSNGLHIRGGRANQVTIEARYTVGEYDILILSAKESGGLEQWLQDNGYRIPDGASHVLAS